jgi:hypothetical protein
MSFSATLQSPEPAARFVECEDCAACGASVTIVDGDDDAAKAAAIAAWNTRVTSPAGQEASRAAPPAMDREAVKEAQFLLDRLEEFEREITDDEVFTHFNGHVSPSAARLRMCLSTLSADAIRQGEGELRNAIRNDVVNTPETADFMAGVPLEAAHQRDRWGVDHDAGKAPLDWFWLIGYLAQKAADAAMRGDSEKARHHTISTAAALGNWHAALTGADTRMRPGIAIPASHASDGGEA